MKDFSNFMKALKSRPAKIHAEITDNDRKIEIEGHSIDLLSLSIEISEHMINNTHIEVDTYCKMLKDAIKFHSMSKKEKEQMMTERTEEFLNKLFGGDNKKDE